MGISKKQLGNTVLQIRNFIMNKLPGPWTVIGSVDAVAKDAAAEAKTIDVTSFTEDAGNIQTIAVIGTVKHAEHDEMYSYTFPWSVVGSGAFASRPVMYVPMSYGLTIAISWASDTSLSAQISGWPEAEHDDDTVSLKIYAR